MIFPRQIITTFASLVFFSAGLSAQELSRSDYQLEAAGAFANSDFKQAESLYNRAVELYPDMDVAYFHLGMISEMKKDFPMAERCFKKAISADSTNYWYLSALSDLYMKMDSTEKAIPILQHIYKDFKGKATPSCRLILGDYYKSVRNDSLAITLFNETLRQNPEYTPAHFSLAEIYRIQGNFYNYFQHLNIVLEDETISPYFKSKYLNEVVLNPQFVSTFKPQVDTMILRLQDIHPGDSSILKLSASYNIRSGETEQGLELFRQAVALYPQDHSISIEYVSALYYLEKWDELKDAIIRMQETFPDDNTLEEVLAVTLWHLGDTDGAIDTYKRQLRKASNPTIKRSCYTALGDLYQETGDLNKAGKYYKKGISIDPEYIPLLNNYAYFLTKIGKDYQKGLKMSKKTILAEPDNAIYLDTYGWLLYLTGDYEDAKNRFKRAMMFGGNENGVMLDHYADVLWALKDYELALIYYEQADKLDSSLNLSEKIKQRREEIGK